MTPQFPEQEKLNCPRCNSNNTKFCYYNNYNLSQPRHYCKNCRRYWTKGGSLRNIPIGGGSRKPTKRPGSSSKRSSSSNTANQTVPKSQPFAGYQSVDRDRPMLFTASDQFRSLIEGLNSNGFRKDPNLDSNLGSDQNLVQSQIRGSNNAEKYSGGDENGGDSSYWGSGDGWSGLTAYPPGSTFQ